MGKRNYKGGAEDAGEQGVQEFEQVEMKTLDQENEEVISIVTESVNMRTKHVSQITRKIKGPKISLQMTSPQEFKCA